jgi:hypothetical protein
LSVRHRTADVARRLVLAQALVHDLTQKVVVGPGQKLDLGDQLGPHPMHERNIKIFPDWRSSINFSSAASSVADFGSVL